MKITTQIAVLLTASVTLAGCVIGNQFGRGGQDVNITLGNIDVLDGDAGGHLETVNGNIEIGNKARAKSAETVNGNIHVGNYSQSGRLETVNGNIELGENVVINGSLETVNGDIVLQAGTEVSENLVTTNGDILLAAKTRVNGNITFEYSRISSFFDRNDKPKLKIAEGAHVSGSIYLYAPVELVLPEGFSQEKIVRRYGDQK